MSSGKHNHATSQIQPSCERRPPGRGRFEKHKYRSILSHTASFRNDPETLKAIQRRVQEGLPKHRKPVDPNRIDIYIPPSFILSPSVQGNGVGDRLGKSMQRLNGWFALDATTEATESSPESDTTDVISWTLNSTSPMSILGAGRVDPFANYPIKMNKDEQWLIDQMNTGQNPALKTLRECWLPVAIRYPETFHQFLANVGLNISMGRGKAINDPRTVAHHSVAIQLVNNRLSDPVLGISDNVIATVVTFLSYSILTEDFKGWKTHMAGLESVLKLRGGFGTLDDDVMLKRLIYCVDISGASKQDTKPRFPHLETLFQDVRDNANEPEISSHPFQPTLPWRRIFPPSHVLISIFDDLSTAIQYVRSRRLHNQPWQRVIFIMHWIDPIIYRVLGMSSTVNQCDSSSIIQEACRLGILLFFGEIRRKCGVMGISTQIYVTKLKTLLSCTKGYVDWTPFNPLLLWLLFFGMLESWRRPEEDWYVEYICLVAEEMKITHWKGIVAIVKRFLWLEDVFDSEFENFRENVMHKLSALVQG